MKYDFLHALETGRAVGPRTGWQPVYLSLWQGDELVAALVSYAKNNSFGEFIFDFAWAQAHESYGKPYYPKLVTAIPFTPATGSKFLFSPRLTDETRAEAVAVLLEEMRRIGDEIESSSCHALFVPPSELPLYEKAGFTPRHSFQYHWLNDGFATFDDFLATMRSKRRRDIKRERQKVMESGLKIERLTGARILPHHAEIFYGFYEDTTDKRGGSAYLTLDFFERVIATMRDQMMLVLATDSAGTPVAGAVNYFGARTLYGRHWGCREDYKFLHFEVCYYQGIDFCIERGLPLFEAGAQGEHKFQRGFLPSLTYSAHWIREEPLREAINDHIRREKLQLQRLFAQYEEHSPFTSSTIHI